MSYEQFQKDKFDYNEDLRSQVFTNAKIAYTKFQNYLEGFFWFKLMMLSAGYKGSGINDVVWMGDVVNSACHLCAEDRGYFGKRIFLSDTIYSNLNDSNKSLCQQFSGSIYHSSAVSNG